MSTLVSRLRNANVQIIENGKIEKIPDYFSSNYVVKFSGSKKSGYGAVRGFTKAIHKSFSELNVDLEILVEVGDRISWQRTIHATQTGAFQGFPASGRKITWRDMVVSRFEDDRITEEWVVTDLAEALLRSKKR